MAGREQAQRLAIVGIDGDRSVQQFLREGIAFQTINRKRLPLFQNRLLCLQSEAQAPSREPRGRVAK